MKKFNPRKERPLSRITSGRRVKQSFLIITEGERTEPDYFKAFRVTSAKVKILGKGLNTITLVKEALIVRDLEKRKGNSYDQIWVVFDKDDYPARGFNEAIHMAKASGLKVAYSNQAFEFWFLLHFNLYKGELHRKRYSDLLSRLLQCEYSKSGSFTETIYDRLLPMQDTAIKHAETILSEFEDLSPAQAESSTTVHLLVKELNRFK